VARVAGAVQRRLRRTGFPAAAAQAKLGLRNEEAAMRRSQQALGIAAALGLLAATPARAEDKGLRDFCAERPGRATPSCVVDPGRMMLEVDAFDVTRDREDGATNETTLALAPHLRVGLTPTLEAGVAFAPFTEGRAPGAVVRGTGDTVLNLKLSLRNPGGDGTSVAILPFVSAPTAQHGLGAGGFQGGVILPVAAALPSGFGLGFAPEVDAVRNGHGGVEAAYVAVVALSHAVGPGLTGGVELWASRNRAETQATADATLAWIPPKRPNLQLDAGMNLGLNRRTPDVQAYAGVSRRF
jgi:hypothetical protein